MINNRGSITLLAIYICSFMLLLAILVKAIFLENYNYYSYQSKYNLFLIENKIVKNIYDDYMNVKESTKNYNYFAKVVNSYDNDDISYEIKLNINKTIYTYEVIYDKVCERITSFNNTTIIDSV